MNRSWMVPVVVVCASACASAEVAGSGSAGTSATSSGGSTISGSPTGGATNGGASAGGTATGGAENATGGSAGAPVIRACNNLPAAGTWHEISPPEFTNPSNMETLTVAVNPKDGTVFATAANKTSGGNGGTGVFKSTDCGASWSAVSTGANSAELRSGGIWALLVDPIDPQNMYVANGYGNHPTAYRSTNGGVDFVALEPDVDHVVNGGTFVQDLVLDPKEPAHLAVSFHLNCVAPYSGLCFSSSSDSGTTWHEFNGPPGIDGWQEGASLTVFGPTTYFYGSCGGGNGRWGGWYTADTGKTWSQAFAGCAIGAYGGGAHIASDGKAYFGVANVGIYASEATAGSPLGKTWTLLKGAPQASLVGDDGTNLYASYTLDTSGHPFHSAPLSNTSQWTTMPPTSGIGRGTNAFAYDPIHHVMYSANWTAGLWRLITR